ncbi:dihydrofolate reductase family protein [Stackebrandtia nassauensis]|uniref:Bifunctional deaminase-reductase domain protein n=1 Tax=Stackebrandtia nassauensis (strain DSM 44728 / CIP 108903 / NRRL B-16338 / NBRC 102104 / LLR-40K-21) TaxID=446470 RepID=D3PY32_STANL|nr:dihydrofolate reductase family protein [Stackebrandtia nassauensis]ADD45361.1 bifunctional deaminase-reductase domain protein [Stackebrandtia nassauensis DSM 44728]
MRTVIVSNIMSVDGYHEGPGGNVMALNMDAAFDAYNLERFRSAGTVLLGGTSFQMFSSYWPGIADAPADPDNPALDEVNREISRVFNALPKVVVSDSYVPSADNPWYDSTTVVKRAEVADWLTAERQRGSGDFVTFGSRTMWNGLLAQELVDELHLMVGPKALGGGTPVFAAPVELRLLGIRRFDGSDNVVLRYAPVTPAI